MSAQAEVELERCVLDTRDECAINAMGKRGGKCFRTLHTLDHTC